MQPCQDNDHPIILTRLMQLHLNHRKCLLHDIPQYVLSSRLVGLYATWALHCAWTQRDQTRRKSAKTCFSHRARLREASLQEDQDVGEKRHDSKRLASGDVVLPCTWRPTRSVRSWHILPTRLVIVAEAAWRIRLRLNRRLRSEPFDTTTKQSCSAIPEHNCEVA